MLPGVFLDLFDAMNPMQSPFVNSTARCVSASKNISNIPEFRGIILSTSKANFNYI